MLSRTVLGCARGLATSAVDFGTMRIAVIGQSAFASGVYRRLQADGHDVVAVFTVPDRGREDPLACAAREDGIPVYKVPRWRAQGKVLPDVLAQYESVGADLNVLPFCSQFIPMEVIRAPRLQSIVYHPSILPRHRGAAAINWTLIQGDPKAGFSVFWADDGLDTGPILLQEECEVLPNDTVDSIYNRFLFPAGIQGMARAVQMIADGTAPRLVQSEQGATYDPMLNKKELCQINFPDLTGKQLHNFIRGMDKVPGAWMALEGSPVKVYGSEVWEGKPIPEGGRMYEVQGMKEKAIAHDGGMILFGSDGIAVNVQKLVFESGKMINAAKYGLEEQSASDVELTEEEIAFSGEVKRIWMAILRIEVEAETDFFKSGAGSMDVARLVEEIKTSCGVHLENEDIYMATTFSEFIGAAVLKKRTGGKNGPTIEYTGVEMEANNLKLKFPNQLFINNQFVDSSDGGKLRSYNPNNEELICEVSSASKEDVDVAVAAAKKAFEEGDWSKMNARDRGKLLYNLADQMEAHLEELATLESLDSGAVYTLALKTHIGMSIDTWRYFAGWCDKIQGATIPINHARPNKNLTFTRKEPIGVCALVTPWNYPLMMVSWKMAPCLAAGNTVVVKPAQVSPLTAIKMAELTVLAGFPPGVINILPGTGRVCGQALADHPHVRKLGFTGSTPIGKQIMNSCALSNLKRVSLELGGKSPLIIFGDCDLDRAVRQAMGGVFFNKGENCIAAGRVFVDASIHDAFVEGVVREVKKMAIGDPLDRGTAHGPQNHKAHLDKLVEYCQKGVDEGARLVIGGNRLDRKGLFFAPTVFTEVQDHMYIAKEESFGPVMIVSRFDGGDVDGVIKRANASEFGLASGVFTRDISVALRVADRIQAGTCFVNCYNKTDVAAPFGGFKQSGFGKDLGEAALHEYLQSKTVTIEF